MFSEVPQGKTVNCCMPLSLCVPLFLLLKVCPIEHKAVKPKAQHYLDQPLEELSFLSGVNPHQAPGKHLSWGK